MKLKKKTTYYHSGNKYQEYYVDENDKRQGKYKEWYNSGKLKEKSNWKNDERHGLYQYWDVYDGVIKTKHYRNKRPVRNCQFYIHQLTEKQNWDKYCSNCQMGTYSENCPYALEKVLQE